MIVSVGEFSLIVQVNDDRNFDKLSHNNKNFENVCQKVFFWLRLEMNCERNVDAAPFFHV